MGTNAANKMEKVMSASVNADGGDGTYYERDEEIKICSGFLGYCQNPVTYSLSPVVGWFVVADNPNSNLHHGTDHLIGISEDEADQDSDGLLYAHDSGNAHIKTSDDSDSDSASGQDDEYVGKKKQKGKKKSTKFMAIEKFDDEDETHKELHRQLGKK